jgi:hypothetical protein
MLSKGTPGLVVGRRGGVGREFVDFGMGRRGGGWEAGGFNVPRTAFNIVQIS